MVAMVAGLAWFLGTDPMKLSPGAMVPDFRPQYIAPPPYDTLANLPRDTASRLRNSELKWQGEFFGPESLIFDAEGRGPYTGVGDGRVLRYDGPELGWTTFAHTSTNRYHSCTRAQNRRSLGSWVADFADEYVAYFAAETCSRQNEFEVKIHELGNRHKESEPCHGL